MNIADQVFYDIYTFLDSAIFIAFREIIMEWRASLISIVTIAVVLIGYKQMFSDKPDMPNFFKSLTVVIIFYLFIMNHDQLFHALKFAFIDFPIAAGDHTIDGLRNGLSGAWSAGNSDVGNEFRDADLSFRPDGSSTAFGAMWDFSTMIADNVMSQGKWNNPLPYLIGLVLYIIAVALLLVQVVMMATGLLVAVVCILAAPVFSWMFLFKPTKPMFEKWLTFGLGAGFLLYFLIVLMGVLLAFMGKGIYESSGYNVFSPDTSSVNDPEWEFNIKHLLSTVLFSALGIKMIPKAEGWASSISGMAVGALSEATTAAGAWMGQKLGQGAVVTGKVTSKGVDSGARATGRGVKNIRDRIMAQRMKDDPVGIEDKRSSVTDSSGNVSVRPDVKGEGFTMNPTSKPQAENTSTKTDTDFSASSQKRAETKSESTTTSQNAPKEADFSGGSQNRSETSTSSPTVNQNINQDVDVHNNETNKEGDDISEGVGSKERQETHTADKNKVGHDNMTRIDREQNAATKRLRNEVKQIQASGGGGEQGQAQLAASHQAEIQRASQNYSGAELARMKKNINKEFAKLHSSLGSDKPAKPPKKGERQENKDLKDD